MKIEEPMLSKSLPVEAIRAYIPEIRKEINSTKERGELPSLKLKKTVRKKTGSYELELVFMGTKADRHIEQLQYFTKDPDKWRSWGLIVLSKEQAHQLKNFLAEAFP